MYISLRSRPCELSHATGIVSWYVLVFWCIEKSFTSETALLNSQLWLPLTLQTNFSHSFIFHSKSFFLHFPIFGSTSIWPHLPKLQSSTDNTRDRGIPSTSAAFWMIPWTFRHSPVPLSAVNRCVKRSCANRCFIHPRTKEEECCDKQCVAGCTGSSARDCLACAHFLNDGECVTNCPPAKIYVPKKFDYVTNPKRKLAFGSFCVKNCSRKLTESWKVINLLDFPRVPI